MNKTEIKKLVDFALSDKLNQHKKISLGVITEKQAKEIKKYTEKDVQGAERFLDTSFVRHTIKNHGSVKKEEARGQVAINLDDFELIPKILKEATEINYKGKNSLKMDVFEYKYKVDDTYIVLEELRENKHGKRLFLSTLYKIKDRKPKRSSVLNK